jgi:serralysin
MTFGAAIHDADGNLYVGGNGGDHDMNNGTHTSGAIYRVIVDETAGTAHLELVADAPRARSNDGAADPRAMDPFTQVDKSANILIRSPEVTPELPAAPEDGPLADTGYDDLVHGGAGKDTIYGDIGHDTLIGDTHGDTLLGEDGDDFIFGGAGPNWKDNGLISVYDDDGNRFDQFGNPLPEDDDMLFG